MQLTRACRLHTSIEIRDNTTGVRQCIEIGDTGQRLQHTGFRIHLIRAPAPTEPTHNHLVEQKWLEHSTDIARCKELKQRLSLIQLVVTTVGAVNLLNDLLAPLLPASIEKFAHKSTGRQETMCPHIIAVRLTANTGIGLDRSAGHLS